MTASNPTRRSSFRTYWPFFAVYGLALTMFGIIQTDRFALSDDYTWYYQHYTLFGRGDWIPHITACANLLCGHFDVLLWPLSLFSFAIKTPAIWKIIQALSASGAQFVAFLWACDIIDDVQGELPIGKIALKRCALALALINPWVIEACGFDYHDWAIAGLLLVSAGRSFYKLNRFAGWTFAGLTILAGDLAATYVAALGLSLLLTQKRFRIDGAVMIVVATAWLYIAVHVFKMGQAGTGSPLGTTGQVYAFLGDESKGGATGVVFAILKHPSLVLNVFFKERQNFYANIAPSGFLFLAYPMISIVWLLALVENLLTLGGYPNQEAAPGFQYAAVYSLAIPGFAWVMALAQHERIGKIAYRTIVAATLINATVWAMIWIPKEGARWIRVDAVAAKTLNSVLAASGDREVIASNGIAGRFAGRQHFFIYPEETGFSKFPLHADETIFVLTASEGIEALGQDTTNRLVAALLASSDTRVLAVSNDVWAIIYKRHPGQHTLSLNWGTRPIPAVVFSTKIGRRTFAHSIGDDRLTVDGSNARSGYLVNAAIWKRPPGSYTASIESASSRPVRFEIWDRTVDKLLAVGSGTGTRRVHHLAFILPQSPQYEGVFRGIGLFKDLPEPRLPNDLLEIRVFVKNGVTASVFSVDVRPFEA